MGQNKMDEKKENWKEILIIYEQEERNVGKDDAWEYGLFEDSKILPRFRNRNSEDEMRMGEEYVLSSGIYPLMTLVKYHHWCS